MRNPLDYVNSWPAVTFASIAIAGAVGIFALAGPDERITVLAIVGGLATLCAAVTRAAFAVPKDEPPTRLEECPGCEALRRFGASAKGVIHSPRCRSGGDDSGAAVTVDDEPPTRPFRPHRVTLSPRVMLAMLPFLAMAAHV